MLQLDRSHAVINSKSIEIDENLLNIFDVCETPIPDWKPTTKLKPWNQVKGFYLDIETSGLNPKEHEIELIGLIDHTGKHRIIDAYKDERLALIQLFSILRDFSLQFLAVFNGVGCSSHEMGFDIPFIEYRAKVNGLESPFWHRPGMPKTFSTAQLFSKPIAYEKLYLNGKRTAVIDLYHQALAWDFVARKLTSYTLKSIPVQTKLRTDERVTLSYEEMRKCVARGDYDTYRSYLLDDLKDSKLLGDFFLPAIYYQKELLPNWELQSLHDSGNGSKWNDVIKTHYRKPAKSDAPKKIKGALTYAIAGVHYNCLKFDVESLYPYVMLIYGIYSYKDSEGFLLQVLNYLLKFRVELKRKKEEKTATNEEKQREATAKVFLNSGYGALATTGIDYNDPVAASYVTAYGRAIFKHIFKLLEDSGYKVIQADTDGLIVSLGKGEIDLLAKGKEIESWLNQRLPGNNTHKIKVKFESDSSGEAVFVPSREKTGEALKKNYLVFSGGTCINKKGKYKKRDRSLLDKNFQIEFLERLVYKGYSQALDYYCSEKALLESGNYPIEKLQITRKIKVNEKTLVEKGIGIAGEPATFWIGANGETKSDPYDPCYYIDKLDKMFWEVLQCLEEDYK